MTTDFKLRSRWWMQTRCHAGFPTVKPSCCVFVLLLSRSMLSRRGGSGVKVVSWDSSMTALGGVWKQGQHQHGVWPMVIQFHSPLSIYVWFVVSTLFVFFFLFLVWSWYVIDSCYIMVIVGSIWLYGLVFYVNEGDLEDVSELMVVSWNFPLCCEVEEEFFKVVWLMWLW